MLSRPPCLAPESIVSYKSVYACGRLAFFTNASPPVMFMRAGEAPPVGLCGVILPKCGHRHKLYLTKIDLASFSVTDRNFPLVHTVMPFMAISPGETSTSGA